MIFDADARWALCHLRPLAYLLCSWLFRLGFILLCIAFIYSFSSSVGALRNYGVSSYRIFRYSTDIGCQINATSSRLTSWGCKVNEVDFTVENDSWHFVQPIEMSGYEIFFNESMCERNLSRFEVQGFNEQQNHWVVTASCNFRYLETNIRFLPGPCFGPKLSVDLRAPWPIKLLAAVRGIVSLSFVSMAAFGAMGAPRHSESVLKLTLLSLAAIYVASTAGFAASLAQRESVLYALYTAILLCALAALRCDASLTPHAAVLLGTAGILARAAADCGCFDDCGQLSDDPPLELAGLALGALLYLAYQHSALRTVLNAAAADKAAYDREWQGIEAGPERGALDRLGATTIQRDLHVLRHRR